MFLDTDTRYARKLEDWVDNARATKPTRTRAIATVISLAVATVVSARFIGTGTV